MYSGIQDLKLDRFSSRTPRHSNLVTSIQSTRHDGDGKEKSG